MQGIEVTLNRNKQFSVANSEEYEIVAGENNATTILVHFPEEYANFSKRVDFKNIRNEKWTVALYTPEDETKQYGEDFDKLNFAFTLPTPVTINGELQIQFIAYMADSTETFVPFKLLKIIVEDAIMYVKKEGSENPDLILKAYEYSNMALEISRDAFSKIENSERAALSAEESAINAEISAKAAQDSATSAQESARQADERATSAETRATSAEQISQHAEEVSNSANTKSDNAVETANSANLKSDNAVNTSNIANINSEEALEISNGANTKSDNAVSIANTANNKSETAINTANSAQATAEEALNQVVEKMGTKIFIGDSETPEANMEFESDPQTQLNDIKTNKTTIVNDNGGFSCGDGASNTSGMTFKGFTLCDENGKIPVARLFDAIYPVGSIYMSANSTNPGTLFGGTWIAWGVGRVPVGIDSNDENFNSVEKTGGSSIHTLTVEQMPSHNHGVSDPGHGHGFNSGVFRNNDGSGSSANVQKSGGNSNTSDPYISYPYVYSNTTGISINNNGSGQAHNNLQPYITCYMWKRTA